jgi:nucleoside-diphosphate-sugar epimerase
VFLANFYFCFQVWYTLSKTLAEAAAWKFANENNIDMVVINPTMVVGSLLQPEVNESVETILKLINGNSFKDLLTFLVKAYGM